MTSPESGRSLRPPSARSLNAQVGNDPGLGSNSRQRTRILHELAHVRRQAEAARLEAHASRLDASAERLESLLERMDAGEAFAPGQLREFGIDEAVPADAGETAGRNPIDAPDGSGSSPATQLPALDGEIGPPRIRFESWQSIREAQSRSSGRLVRHDGPHNGIKPPWTRWRTGNEDAQGGENPAAREELPSPLLAPVPDELEQESSAALLITDPPPLIAVRDDHGAGETDGTDVTGVTGETGETGETLHDGVTVNSGALLPSPVVLEDDADTSPRGRQSTAVITSAIVHLVLLLCLAGFTLTTVMPKDQIALAASTDEPSEETIETFQIEMAQPASATSATTPDESAVELDPLGEMKMVEVSTDSLGAMSSPAPDTGAFSRHAAAASAAMTAQPNDSTSKMQFCGVEGGGNHFVYLVDSSGSMGDAFISARRALLDSINMLTPQQRFYVIFFDAECDYMRITRADQDESRSVHATPANKQRLQSWAMRVEMDRGKAPYEPLEYALQKLKPDVIFLLSDGEFPQRIETLLQSENKVTNLFGESKPISIIHTISYHSREGEDRMRRIAESNFGQYRHVPKP